MKKYTFIHPFLFLIASLTYIFLISSVTVSPDKGIRVLVLFCLLLALLIPCIYWLTRNSDLASIFLSLIVISFFTEPTLFQIELFIVGLAIFLFYIIYYLMKWPFRTFHIVNTLNLVSVTIVVILVGSAFFKFRIAPIKTIPQITWEGRTFTTRLTPTGQLPDIYIIVLDGYGRDDILQEYYDYDNSKFIETLRSKGFIVPTNAHSNYVKTVQSISSALNMNYISEILPELENSDAQYWWLLEPLIEYSEIRLMLEDIGYTSYAITSGWGLTDNTSFDNYYQPYPVFVNDFEFMAFFVTPMKFIVPLLSDIAYFPSYERHREIFHYNFSTLEEISKLEGPKFVFSHLVSPHPPFVFDKNGETLTPNYGYTINDANDLELTDEEYRVGYVNQVEYLNTHLEGIVDKILENSTTPPIIILQSDHGPGMLTDFSSFQNTCLRERFSVFAAYYLPSTDPKIPQDITPVNLFRFIFNEYFDTDFPILQNNHYFIKQPVQVFRNDNVSSLIDTCSVKP